MVPSSEGDLCRSEAFEKEIANANTRVGQVLVSESEFVRVWQIRLEPGDRFGFHRHELDYCWIAINAGRSRSVFADGSIVETAYEPGDCKVFAFAENEKMIHDLTNVGDDLLTFTTIEFKAALRKAH